MLQLTISLRDLCQPLEMTGIKLNRGPSSSPKPLTIGQDSIKYLDSMPSWLLKFWTTKILAGLRTTRNIVIL
jgi:hypothetical protein